MIERNATLKCDKCGSETDKLNYVRYKRKTKTKGEIEEAMEGSDGEIMKTSIMGYAGSGVEMCDECWDEFTEELPKGFGL